MANDDDFLLVSFSDYLTARNYSLKRARQLPRLKSILSSYPVTK